MADFLFLFRRSGDAGDPSEHFSPEAAQQSLQKWAHWIGELSKEGNFKAGEPLAPEGRQLIGKSKRVVDGPFTEAKDLVGGYVIVHAADLNHATELARGCPILDFGGNIEIRPIQESKL